MKFEGFSEKYKTGVIECLKRNFDSLSEKSNKEIEIWLKPLVSYNWVDDIEIEKYPYKYGMVIVNNDHVCGYLGLIYSRQIINNESAVVVNLTTWAIDDNNVFLLYSAINKIHKTADVFTDYDARDSVYETLTKIYHYKYIDNLMHYYTPFPLYFVKHGLSFLNIKSQEKINNKVIRNIFIDHSKYNVSCLEIQKGERKEYIFYKLLNKKYSLRGINLNMVLVLYTSDISFFHKYEKTIISYLQRKEKAVVVSAKHFFNTETSFFSRRTMPIKHIIFSNDKEPNKLGMLYSEICLLDND